MNLLSYTLNMVFNIHICFQELLHTFMKYKILVKSSKKTI